MNYLYIAALVIALAVLIVAFLWAWRKFDVPPDIHYVPERMPGDPADDADYFPKIWRARR